MAKTSLPPGFRFHPTDVELTVYYLKRKLLGKHIRCNAITEIDLYKFAPWDLPEKASLQSNDLVWYFFCPRDRKYSSGVRTNRSTGVGYWKATGKDRLEDKDLEACGVKLDACVLCKIFQKSGPGPKIGAQYGAPFNEADWNDCNVEYSSRVPSMTPYAPESSHDELNSAGQHLDVSNNGNVSLDLLSENNGEHAANHVQVCPDRPPDFPFDSVRVQLLAEIINCSSMNLIHTADGSQPGSTPDNDNETIFSELGDPAPQSVARNSHHCDSCGQNGQNFIQPKLAAVEGEQYLELNDLSFSLVDDLNSGSLPLSSDAYVQHPLDRVPRLKHTPLAHMLLESSWT